MADLGLLCSTIADLAKQLEVAKAGEATSAAAWGVALATVNDLTGKLDKARIDLLAALQTADLKTLVPVPPTTPPTV